MSKNCHDNQLEHYRYNSELFKQACRASNKLEKAKSKTKKERRFKILLAIFTLIVLSASLFFFFKQRPFQKDTYIKSKAEVEAVNFIDVKTEYEPSAQTEQEFDEEFINSDVALYSNLNTGEILYAKNIDKKVYIASISKLMTVLISLREYELSDEVEVKKDWYADENMSWTMGLDKGVTITVENLLKAVLVSSYNDAAFVLANNMEGGWESFVEEMNLYASRLGLNDTKFNNPSGLDLYGGNSSTARDLYKLITIVYRNDFIMNILSKRYMVIEWNIGQKKLYSTNAILGEYGNIAGKTGFTESAGECFLGITDEGMMTLVLGSNGRFVDTKKMLTGL
jgi:D-alanyl-D-alanine carboxypeptidase